MISVVMATYNGEKFIEEQLQSIYDQTLKPDEVLIFDDRSTDDTVHIVKNFIKKNDLYGSWKITINEKNKGFFRNFMDGAFEAHGDTIYFSDQDDIWAPHKIEKLEECLKIPDVMMAQSDMLRIDQDGALIPEKNKDMNSSGVMELSVEWICKFAGLGFTMGMKRQVIDFVMKYNLDDEIFGAHDMLCSLTASSLGRNVLVRDVKDRHRLHYANLSEQKDKTVVNGRTKQKQLEILMQRKKYFMIIADVTGDVNKKGVFEAYSALSGNRMSYIKRFSLKKLKWLIKHRRMYLSEYGVIADTMYSLGMEKILLKVLK